MKNPFSRAGVVNGISKVYGVAHLLAAAVPELLVEMEVASIKLVSKKGSYDSNVVRYQRYKHTEEVHDKIKAIPKLTYNKFRLVSARARESVKNNKTAVA